MELTPEQLQQLASTVADLIMPQVHDANQGLAANITRELKQIKQTNVPTSPSEPASAANVQLRELQQQVEQLRTERHTALVKNAVRDAIDTLPANVRNKDLLKRLCEAEALPYIEVDNNGVAVYQRGETAKTLTTYVSELAEADAFKPRTRSAAPLVDDQPAPDTPAKPSKEDILNKLTI